MSVDLSKSVGMKNAPLAFVDFETTGLDIEKHEITEIGLLVASQPDFKILDEWETKVLPEHIETADPVALDLNGYDEKIWTKEAIPLEEALKIFIEKTQGAIMVAHNVSFDAAVLEKAYAKTGLVGHMDYHRLDSLSFAFALLYKNKDVQKFSLRSLAEYFEIENKKAHTALSDVRTTYQFVKKLLNE